MNTFDKIYQIVSKIPKGKVMTYKQVAEIAGVKNPRVVGFALRRNKNPKLIPCHRVVSSKGKLTGYAFGGIKKKKETLEKEGVEFLDEATVNLEKCLYSIISSSSTISSPEL